MAEEVVLKRYANRRLYDTSASRHVTLAQAADMIRGGKRLRVVAAKGGEDLTALVLTQILLEEAKNRDLLLPPDILHMIIRHGPALDGFFRGHLKALMEMWLGMREAADKGFRSILGLDGAKRPTPADGLGALRRGLEDFFGLGKGPKDQNRNHE